MGDRSRQIGNKRTSEFNLIGSYTCARNLN